MNAKIPFFRFVLFVSVLWCFTGATIFGQSYSGGDGTSGNPYQIANKADLKYLSENSGEWSKSFKQTADITFAASDFQNSGDFYNGGSGFIPIGHGATNFTGTYDGDGHTITGLFISRGGTNYVGLFGYTAGAAIQNIGLINADITGSNFVGGLVGVNNSFSTVSSSYSTGSVTGSSLSVGGLVGGNFISSTVSNSYSTGSVTGSVNVGGLVGENSNFSTVSNSYSTGSVTGSNFVGGLVGANFNSTVSNSFWDKTTSGTTTGIGGGTTTGATGKTTAEMKTLSTFTGAGWDFTSTWAINSGSNDGYPYLSWQIFNTSAQQQITALTTTLIQISSNDKKINKSIEEALKHIEKSLDSKYWLDENQLDLKDGKKVFDENKEAVKKLSVILKQKDVEQATINDIQNIVISMTNIFKDIAEQEISYVSDNCNGDNKCLKEIEKANEQLTKAAEEIAKENYDKAIEDYKKAWGKAAKMDKKLIQSVADASSLNLDSEIIPKEFSIAQNYPNPFNPTTIIKYGLPEASFVSLKIYNVLGQEVKNLLNDQKNAGTYSVQWNGDNNFGHKVSSGTYIYRIVAGNNVSTKKMILMK